MKARSMSIPDIDSTLPVPMKQQKTYILYTYYIVSSYFPPTKNKTTNFLLLLLIFRLLISFIFTLVFFLFGLLVTKIQSERNEKNLEHIYFCLCF